MSMSKKDFIALADALRSSGNALTPYVIDRLCEFMRAQNGAFDEDRWRDYLAGRCGPSGGRVK